MGLADVFAKEDRVDVTYTDFYRMMKEATLSELLMNAVNCDVPHEYIRNMATGVKQAQEGKKYEHPECYTPEQNNPYPLCIGRDKPECEECQLRADWEPDDPYGVGA